MLAFLPLIQRFLVDYMTKKTHQGFSFNFQAMGLLLFSAIMGFITLLFLLFALQTYLVDLYGAPLSWLLTAAVTAIFTLLSCAFVSYSKRKKAIIHKMKEEVQDRMTPIAKLVEELAEPIKDHPLAAVALAALAGVLAGDKLNSNGTED